MTTAPEPGGADFAAGRDAWLARLGNTRDAVRQELIARQLGVHLGSPAPLRVLDVGCGQATLALRLARAGHLVTGVDPSEELLAVAAGAVARAEPGVCARVTLLQGDLHDLDAAVEEPFDLVCCHGVLMYVPSLDRGLNALVQATRSGGLISVLTRNRAGIAMRAGMTGDWRAALAGFDARRYNNRIGVANVRADEPEEVIAGLDDAGATTVAWYGVRLFSDHWGDVPPPADFEQLVAAEEEAGRRDPYRRLAALTHVVARRDG